MATKEALRPQDREKTPAVGNPEYHEIAPLDDVIDYAKAYARQKPETAALICIGIGFVLGWKLKPW